jgi:hypothetical protein
MAAFLFRRASPGHIFAALQFDVFTMWLQVIAAVISGASLQGVVGPGSSPPFACLSYGNFWAGGGLGFVSKYKPKDGSLGGAFNCSAIEFSVLKQPKHRNDMYAPASMHMVIMRKTYFRDIVVIAQWLAPIMMHMLQVTPCLQRVESRVVLSQRRRRGSLLRQGFSRAPTQRSSYLLQCSRYSLCLSRQTLPLEKASRSCLLRR